MTDMEKKVITRICTKIITETDFYLIDHEMKALIDWLILTDSLKKNNNKIRKITGEYHKTEQGRREGVREALEQCKIICEKRNQLYEEQQKIKDEIRLTEKVFNR